MIVLETMNMLAFGEKEVEMLLNGLGWRIDQATDDCVEEKEMYDAIEKWLDGLHADRRNALSD